MKRWYMCWLEFHRGGNVMVCSTVYSGKTNPLSKVNDWNSRAEVDKTIARAVCLSFQEVPIDTPCYSASEYLPTRQ